MASVRDQCRSVFRTIKVEAQCRSMMGKRLTQPSHKSSAGRCGQVTLAREDCVSAKKWAESSK